MTSIWLNAADVEVPGDDTVLPLLCVRAPSFTGQRRTPDG
jgi:hypothetical protein